MPIKPTTNFLNLFAAGISQSIIGQCRSGKTKRKSKGRILNDLSTQNPVATPSTRVEDLIGDVVGCNAKSSSRSSSSRCVDGRITSEDASTLGTGS